MAGVAVPWSPDAVFPPFEALTLAFPPDYDGPVVATLVRRRADAPPGRAVLYIHGFVDYFFQAHMAEEWRAQGYHFYALDLRKHGRSLRDDPHPNFCRSVDEYYPEITAALDLIAAEDGRDLTVLNGHSTGGLICALYAHEGARRERIGALFLNSPFFAFNLPRASRAQLPLAARIGALAPFRPLPQSLSPAYGESIHRDHRGEWTFDLAWKPLAGFPGYYGWLRAIHIAQRRLARGLAIACPILVMHAASSVWGGAWEERFQTSDGVLDVADIRRLGVRLGPAVTTLAIPDGMHDLVLSRPDVRERVFRELFAWLAYVERGAWSARRLG